MAASERSERGAHATVGRELKARFASFAARAASLSGSVWAFSGALFVVLVWAATGPLFRFSDTWQLVINTGTTVVTFLMVFLIQHAQNRDVKALHLKLDELVSAVARASNQLIDVEDLPEEDIERLGQRYRRLALELRRRSTAPRRFPRGAVIPSRRGARTPRRRGNGKRSRAR